MKKMDKFINQYSLQKTLRFSLIPVGKTEEYFNERMLLEEDEKRAEAYEKVKGYMDEYHKAFIEKVLSHLVLSGLTEYAGLYYKTGKNEKDLKDMEKAEEFMRKFISKAFTGNKEYKMLFGKEMVTEILPGFLKEKDKLVKVELFSNFSTYFKGFNDNRENIYKDNIKSSVAYRCINDNLPKFLDNCKIFEKAFALLGSEDLEELSENAELVYGVELKDAFCTDYFSFVLSQSGIDRYNGVLGGFSCKNGKKVKGINELINLYNQKLGKDEKTKKLPLMKQLYKQILSDRESVSFIPEAFRNDNEVILAVKETYDNEAETISEIRKLFSEFDNFDASGIYILTGAAVSELSNKVFGKWNAFSDGWKADYEEKNPMKKEKSAEDYLEKIKKDYGKIKSFSLFEIQKLGERETEEKCFENCIDYFKKSVIEKCDEINLWHEKAENLLSSDYEKNNNKKLCNNDEAIEQIKNLLDAIKGLEWLIKPLLGTGKEENRDGLFYGVFESLCSKLFDIDRLYDKVRNYITKKPYSKDKIKLNFGNPQLLGGWDRNKERDYRSVLLRKDEAFYLAIMDKENNKCFLTPPVSDGCECYEKMEYKLLPGPNKMLPKVFFASSNIEYFAPDKRILDIRKKESFKKGDSFNIEDCHEFIDFFKDSINKHEDWSKFGFEFSPTKNYKDISEFYNEVKKQGYSLEFSDIPEWYIDELVEKGYLYLFKIYNKDFSEYSHGKANLHTLYFKMLFDERNLSDVVYKLNGEAEMFYRKASIRKEDMVVHRANEKLENKNPLNDKKHSTFAYDLIKDRRFTKRQFSLHLPITLNFKADGQDFLNSRVRYAIKHSEKNYIIGIDRGERNLLYISVIDETGRIVEQKSLNNINSSNGSCVDYHELLDRKEKERDIARKSWGTIENIKELKEGYLSIVIHEICKLAIKYDAIIAMEDLNFGFKKGRFKVEKQVYQKFENMLINKLNYLVDKNAEPTENGGLLRAYQLTNKVDGVNKGRQNGIIFYVPAYLTSKIDPVTGFADLIKPKFTSVNDSVALLEKIDAIRYNAKEDMFEFNVDYSNFAGASSSFRKKWTVYSNADRIRTFRNSEKNNEWDNETVVLTEEFKKLFEKYGIDYCGDIKSAMTENRDKKLHEGFIRLFALTLQMRNSVTGKVDIDYLISPVKDDKGMFYDSRRGGNDSALPENADANGAYNIARKALWAVNVLKNSGDDSLSEANLSIKNADWFEFVQK